MRNKAHRNRRKEFCGRKLKYLNREDAAADMIKMAVRTAATNLNVYRCQDCREYHVGHMLRATRELLDAARGTPGIE